MPIKTPEKTDVAVLAGEVYETTERTEPGRTRFLSRREKRVVRSVGSYEETRDSLMWFTTAVPLRGLGLGMGTEGD